jgi:putative membrane protein
MMGYGNGYGGGGYGGGYNNMMGGGFGGLLILLFGLLFIVGVVLLVLWAVRASHGHGQSKQGTATSNPGAVGHDEAVAVAKKRLASGEITPEQYAEIMRHLGG